MRHKKTLIMLFIFSYTSAVAGLVLAEKLSVYVLPAILLLSFITYASYAKDKKASAQRQWRVPENNLHFLALIGGWPGALVAQHHLRHKSSKTAFKVVFYITVILNIAAITSFVLYQDLELRNRIWNDIKTPLTHILH